MGSKIWGHVTEPSGCGWSHTWKTLSDEMNPKPECVACALLSACRMSPEVAWPRRQNNCAELRRIAQTCAELRRIARPRTLGGEDERLEASVVVRRLLGLQHLLEALEHLLVGELREAEDGAARLDRLDDLVRHVARQGEAGGRRVDLHRAPHRLLRALGHRVGLVEHDDLVLAGRQRHLLLGECLDPVPHDVDPAVVRRVELEHALLVRVAQQLARERQHARRLPRPRRAGEDEVRHVPLLRQHLQPAHRLLVAHDVLDLLRAVLLEPLRAAERG